MNERYSKSFVNGVLKEMSEDELANLSPSSSKSFEAISRLLRIPRQVRGSYFLDIGGGSSDFTAKLMERGARAYSVDIRYKSEEDINLSTREHIARINARFGAEAIEDERKSLSRFQKSLKMNPNNYIAAKATSLPFRDNQFDYVYSTTCLTVWLDLQREIFFEATLEALRVLKPKGILQIYPFLVLWPEGERIEPQNHLEKIREENQRALLDLFPRDKFHYDIQKVEGGIEHSRLVVVKF